MSYIYHITETLKDYSNELYKMIEIRIILPNSKFEHRAVPLQLTVVDGFNKVRAFINQLSGNQKELMAYFTVDAFTGFAGNATIEFGYDSLLDSIDNVDIQNITPLPAFLVDVPHQIADNAWLATL